MRVIGVYAIAIINNISYYATSAFCSPHYQKIENVLKSWSLNLFLRQKDLEKIDWVKPHFFIVNNDLTGPVSGVRGNTLRLWRKSFKSRLRNDFSQLVTVRNNFLFNRVVSIWNSLPDDVLTSLTLNITFKSDPDRYYKKFRCNSSQGIGFLT